MAQLENGKVQVKFGARCTIMDMSDDQHSQFGAIMSDLGAQCEVTHFEFPLPLRPP